jgi:branched-chain amino acid transport system permease protein
MNYFFIDLAETLLSGIIIGSLYASMALGLTIIYGVVRIFNFGHGSIAVLGGYLTLLILTWTGLNIIPAMAAVLVIMFLFGLGLYKVTIRFLLQKPNWEFAAIIFLLGLAILIENLMLKFFGPRVKAFPKFFAGSFDLGPLMIKWHDICLLIIVIVFFIGLNLFLKKTWRGKAMRAVAQEITGSQVVGINTNRTFGFAFGLGTAATALGGILLATKFNLVPGNGWGWMTTGFIIVVFGGLGSVPGAICAAFILGFTEAFISIYSSYLWVRPIWFLLFAVVLVIRPQGLFGSRST